MNTYMTTLYIKSETVPATYLSPSNRTEKFTVTLVTVYKSTKQILYTIYIFFKDLLCKTNVKTTGLQNNWAVAVRAGTVLILRAVKNIQGGLINVSKSEVNLRINQ